MDDKKWRVVITEPNGMRHEIEPIEKGTFDLWLQDVATSEPLLRQWLGDAGGVSSIKADDVHGLVKYLLTEWRMARKKHTISLSKPTNRSRLVHRLLGATAEHVPHADVIKLYLPVDMFLGKGLQPQQACVAALALAGTPFTVTSMSTGVTQTLSCDQLRAIGGIDEVLEWAQDGLLSPYEPAGGSHADD